ncbi:MAG TPA: hypothetical protein VHK63_00795 [Candidatus Limnocylindria bacterium]|nr:hypothetical protein [Candidatus Limnocylindria bacterium]
MKTRRAIFAALLAASALIVPAIAIAAGTGSDLATVRAATARFHQFDRALAEGYGQLHTCTDEETGLGAMGVHYVKGAVVGDLEFDLTQPEVLVYEPMPNGRMRLVAVEFVVFQEPWDAQFEGETVVPPQLFGRDLTLVPAPNRYGVPAFYQIHVWLWNSNPAGIFNDWNERVSCHGMGDPQ